MEFKRIKPPLDLVKIKKKYEGRLNNKKENNVPDNDKIDNALKNFKDTDYSDKNRCLRRIANFTFIKKNESNK